MLALSQTSPSQAASRREQIILLADALAALPGCRGRRGLALCGRKPFVRGDRRAVRNEPKIGPRHHGAGAQEPEALDGRSPRWIFEVQRWSNPLTARPDGPDLAPDGSDEDDRVGEAVEVYMLSCEQGPPPDLDEFVARFPGLEDDLRAAIDGLELVHGLLGLGSATGSGSGRRGGLDHRIESGQRIAGYRVVRELGRGGMGTVYEAVHVGLDRPVALKVLGVHAAPDSSARRRFLNEARTAAGLHHTHIVPVFDVGQVGGLCYYAMQRIEGSGLDRVLKHLRRTRHVASGGGEALSSSRLPNFLASGGAGAAQANARPRLGRLLGRPSRKPSAGGSEPDGPLEQAKPPGSGRASSGTQQVPARPNGIAPKFLIPPGDGSTASWGTASHDAGCRRPIPLTGGLQAAPRLLAV